MELGYPDRRLWMESYVEEAMGLKEQDTYVVINTKDYDKNYQNIQIIPTMNVQTIKKDERGEPDRAKSRIVALGNYEDRIWERARNTLLSSETRAPEQ
jgi:choline dehydrogenase-like flavoprotein